jgi:hypothetical protein
VNLKRKHLEAGANVTWTQVGHRRTAIEYAVAGAKLAYKQSLEQFPDDPLFAELESVMPEWVIETIAQGAYIREYHLWEKEVKDYLVGQLRRSNLESTVLKPKRSESLIDAVRRVLVNLGAPDTGLADIDAMRHRVNIAKHEPGVLVEHFVSIDDYWKVLDAIEGFWEALAEHEEIEF